MKMATSLTRLEVLHIPFSRAVVPFYGQNCRLPIDFFPNAQDKYECNSDVVGDSGNNDDDDNNSGSFLLGCLQVPSLPSQSSPSSLSSSSCVIYLHGFPDQNVDHRKGNDRYGKFSSRMSKKLSESFVAGSAPDNKIFPFCAFNFSGSPGSCKSTTTLSEESSSSKKHQQHEFSFYDKTVTQEVWDVLNVMSYLHREKSIGTSGFHIIGLSTGAIVGSLLRNVLSSESRRRLGNLPPILSISIVASCGATDINTALNYDFDEQQQTDFDTLGYCYKQFWLPKNEPNNPNGATVLNDNKIDDKEKDEQQQRWVPHLLKLGRQYKDDFLQLPIKQHVQGDDDDDEHNNNDNMMPPLLVIHGKLDKNVPFEEGKALFDAASEPKKFVEIPKGNHLLTNSKDMKKCIRAIHEWIQLHDKIN